MASELATTLGEFEATIQNTKNRLIAIPAPTQRTLGLERRAGHLIHLSLRKHGVGRWNHHYFKLTGDNEFSIPTDVVGLQQGDRVQVKVHAVIPNKPLRKERHESGAALLARLARAGDRQGWRTDGAERHDHYLREDIIASGRS